MNFSSKLIEDAVNQISQLPGIGKKSALRMVLSLLKKSEKEVEEFSSAIHRMRKEIQYCSRCYNVSDDTICSICTNPSRKRSIICVVENIRDLMALENTQQFNGRFHVLGGLISPLDGVGPSDLSLEALFERVEQEDIQELIMALSPTMEGDTTTFYINKKIKSTVRISALSRGVAFGGELEYADELTLGKSLENRIPIDQAVKNE